MTDIPDTFPSDEDWTPEDCQASFQEGWGLWDSDGSENGRTQLCVYDDTDYCPAGEKFDGNDTNVWKYVVERAKTGSVLHVKALTLITKHNPIEAGAIVKLCGDWISQ